METQTNDASAGILRPCEDADFFRIAEIINHAAEAYRGVVPEHVLHQPYMSEQELQAEIAAGVLFWACEADGAVVGVMCMQRVDDVALIRHAYVCPEWQGRGVGGRLLSHFCANAGEPLLVGTWAAAVWAIGFYEKHGFKQVKPADKEHLLRRYWTISEEQIAQSVVLADSLWRQRNPLDFG